MPIPKVIYQTWKTKNLNENCIKIKDAIQALNPDYEMILYDDAEMDSFIQNNYSADIYNCFLQLNVGAAKADFWRYCVLYKNGGVYLDMDSEIVKPLDQLIQGYEQCIITRESNPGIFNNWIMIFEKEHPILLQTILNCCRNIMNRTTNNILHLTGPAGPFTDAINQTMVPFYNNQTHLYFEDDDKLNEILNNPINPVRCRFYGVDMESFAKWKHAYTADLYEGVVGWQNETVIFRQLDSLQENAQMAIAEHLQIYQFDKKLRCGINRDGGYVFADLDGEYDCYISAGISDEESFSRDFINKYGGMNEYNCFGFDGTIAGYPYHYTNKISFIRKNIGVVNDDADCNLSFLTSKYSNIFLKMDIEGGEYPWITSIDEEQLSKFKQIVIEFHGITDDSWGCKNDDKIKCLEKLAKTHYMVHAHGNNYGPVVNNIPDVIELTYVNKSYFNTVPELNTQSLPIANLDFPNRGSTDIDLNFYPFVQKR